MRPYLTALWIFTLLWAGAPATLASAQTITANELEVAAEEIPEEPGESEVEIITQEPAVAGHDALVFNAELLDALLERSTKQTITEQKFAAAAGITGGMIMLGLASWRLIEEEPQSQYSRGLGVMFLTLGMADLTTGVYAATRIPHERRRLERWQKARHDGITAVELAHFEGELQSSHEIRQGERLLVRWNALTHAIAGLIVLAYTPIPDSLTRADKVSGYIVGGLFFAVGMATFAASFRGTPSEKAWKDYTGKKKPMPGHEFRWGVAPTFSKRSAGVSFGGAF